MVYSNNFGQTRVGIRNGVVTQVVNAVDADATAFIAAAGITNLTQAAAISTLVNDLKAYGLWTKMKALYPMVGGTATSHKFNLKDPRDLDAAFRLVFYGGWTHTSNGALPNGTTGYADTNLVPSTRLNLNSTHACIYSRTNTNSNFDFGVYDGATTACHFSGSIKDSSGKAQFRINRNGTSATSQFAMTTSSLFYLVNRPSSTLEKLYLNGLSNSSMEFTYQSNSLPNLSLYIGAIRYNYSSSSNSNREFAFSSFGDSLSDTDASNFYTAVQKFQTTLGRQIGSPIVSDTDAQAFINAAGLTDLGQANAVNTLVVDLKAAGVWTKMKAIYPFVGGTAAKHIWNLKDPRDSDVAYRAVFAGGWTHDSNGALGNGVTNVMYTNLNPYTNLTNNNNHLSVYSNLDRTDGALTDKGLIAGSMDGSYSLRFALAVSNNDTDTGAVNTTTSTSVGFTESTKLGFYTQTRTSSTSLKLFKNGNVSASNTGTNTTNLPNFQLYLGAWNVGGNNRSAFRRLSFASIGDGLTDTDASAFYTAVQKFQTTLGRQIGTPVLAEGQTAGLLDTYNGAAAAYSLRKLRNGYYGNAIRVRRSSDNAEQDIAFKSDGTLDTTSLLAFVGNGNGFVTTWYDQSGNLSNLIQTTASNQARIVYNGVLETLNGKPALVTNYNYSNSGFYTATYSSTINGPATVFNIGSNVATAGASYLWDGLNTNMYAYSYNNTWMRIGGSAEFALTGYTQGITTQRIINAIYNGASSKLRINNGTYTTGNTGTIAVTGLTLGGAKGGGYLARAYNQEHIVYPSNQETNATNINTNINSYYSIY